MKKLFFLQPLNKWVQNGLLSLIVICGVLIERAPAQAAVDQPQTDTETMPLEAGIVNSPEPTRNLNLATCFMRAEARNKELLSARWNITIARAQIRSAGAIPNPKFQIQVGAGPAFSRLFTGQTEQAFWTQQIQTAGKRTKKIELALANFKLAERQFLALQFDLHNRVRRAYAELVAAEAYSELVAAQRQVGMKLLKITSKRVEQGKAAQTEFLQAKINVSQFDTLSNQSKIRLQQASAALALITGETPERIEVIDVVDNGLFKLVADKSEIVPSPARPLPELKQLQQTAVALRPDLESAKQQIAVKNKAMTLAKAQRIPDIYIGAGFSWAAWARSQPPGVAPQQNSLGNGAFLNVTAENPIFYQYQGEIKQSIGNLRLAERQYDLLECQTAGDIVTAYNEVSVSRSNIFIFQEKLLPAAAEAARIARRGYEVGKMDLATAIVAQQQYQQILSNYFDTVVAYQTAWADLEKATGAPLRL